MKYNNKQISKTAGSLILTGIVIGILSIVPSVEGERYLVEVYPEKQQVFIGSIFQFFLVPIYIGFALSFYPLLKHFSKALSIGFVGFRFMAATFQLIGIILLPLFVVLSHKYLNSNSSDIAIYQFAGNFLRLFRDLTNHLGVILATGLGNFLFYIILYRNNLVPKWLSLWGLFANLVIMLASFSILFQWIEVVSIEYGLMSFPIVFQEIVLAIWLLVKGLTIEKNTTINFSNH